MVLVSVIIPAYNQGHFLGEAIQSVLEQTLSDFEILVIDDGSTDNTSQVAQSYSDKRLKYIYQQNRGLSGARNTGIRNSVGKYISYLDSDDLFLAEKLALLTEELENKPDLAFVAGQAIPIDEKGRQVGKTFDTPPPEDTRNLLLGNPLHVGSVLLCRTWQERVGYFDENLRSYEDWDMWLRLARAGCKMGWVAKPVSLYRFHGAQMTRIGKQMTNATFAVLEKVYSDPALPDNWRSLKSMAYSQAHLRAAAQDYHAKNFDAAQTNIEQAVQLNPALLVNNAAQLANTFLAWTDLPKTPQPLDYLKRIYHNLPPSLEILHKRRNQELAKATIQAAFAAYNRGDMNATRQFALRAFLYNPMWLLNRGAIVIFLRASLHLEPQKSDNSNK